MRCQQCQGLSEHSGHGLHIFGQEWTGMPSGLKSELSQGLISSWQPLINNLIAFLTWLRLNLCESETSLSLFVRQGKNCVFDCWCLQWGILGLTYCLFYGFWQHCGKSYEPRKTGWIRSEFWLAVVQMCLGTVGRGASARCWAIFAKIRNKQEGLLTSFLQM